MANIWKNCLTMLMELNLFFFFILLFYMDAKALPSIPGVLAAYAATVGIYILLSKRLPDTYVSIMFVAPVISLLAYLLNFHIAVAILMGLFLSYRGFMYFIEERRLSSFTLLMNSFFWMPIIYVGGVAAGYPYGSTLLALFAGQLALVLLLYTGETLFSLKGNAVMQKSVIASTAAVIGLVLAVTVMFSTLGKWVLDGAFGLFGSAVSYIAGLIARPIIYLLGLHDWTVKPKGPVEESGIEFEGDQEPEAEMVLDQGSLFDNPWVLAIAAIVVITVLFLILRKKRVEKDEDERMNQTNFLSSLTKRKDGFRFSRNVQKPPEDQVRRLMYDLEKLAKKKDRGRYPFETLEDWLNRESFLKQEFMQLYAKVRYGELQLTEEEHEQCREMAQELRKTLKELKKAG
ncbi:hypothetical protein LC085_05310 [Bacillus tianshenii]|uniref:hypothetical protein n=1 Tax=Sutcliffiella tianshenii TaxID=1463404 RepID=UPI001CD62EA7|nr:hypothetical protein [Bacillus tianshenii]MCA1319326.1 hypothetical protein [Bacillus tianshenii]